MNVKTLQKIEIFLLAFLLVNIAQAQYHWQKNPANPIIQPDSSTGVFAFSDPVLVQANGRFHLWASGGGFVAGNPNPGVRVYYFTSTDGQDWTPYAENPVIHENAPGTWDSGHIETPHVIQVDDAFWLYYVATVDSQIDDPANLRLGLATSLDGIHWTRHPANPLLARGGPGSWDARWIESPCIYKSDSLFYLWFNGVGADWKIHVGLATSTDGLNWEKSPHNPVFSPTEAVSWESAAVYAPQVREVGGQLVMFYTGLAFNETGYDFENTHSGIAVSSDGIHWTRMAESVLGGTENDWDATGPFTQDWLPIGDEFWLYYVSSGLIGQATAPIELTRVLKTENTIINSVKLFQNFPNPFNATTIIPFYLSQPGEVKLEIYDVLGRLVRSHYQPNLAEGYHQIVFNGRDMHGRSLPAGIYFYQIANRSFRNTQKLVILP